MLQKSFIWATIGMIGHVLILQKLITLLEPHRKQNKPLEDGVRLLGFKQEWKLGKCRESLSTWKWTGEETNRW
jgi:hypothetical protein